MNYIKKLYGLILRVLTVLLGINFAKNFDSVLRMKRKLNLKNPQTLSDKVSYLFLHGDTALMSYCADKWAVREYISSKGLKDILIPTAGGPWNNTEGIDFKNLPNNFILKATHGCKMNYIVQDKSKLNIENCKKILSRWFNTVYGTYSLEPHYKNIKPRVYAEVLLGKENELADYKIHCLNGKPQFILVCSGRDSSKGAMQVTLDLFDTDWKNMNRYLQPSGAEKAGNGNIRKPELLGKMLEIAANLSADFRFVRVDLYEIKGKIYFGELTFSPACGVFPYFTDEFIKEMGQRLKI